MSAPLPISAPKSTAVLVIFGLTYLSIALGRVPGLKLNRPGIALLGAIAMLGVMHSSAMPSATVAVVDFINWPTILLLFGFFVMSAQLRLSGFYDLVAGSLAARLDHPGRFLLTLMLVAGVMSAFLNNDVVAFVLAPVIGTALLRRKLNPVPYLIALAVACNIGAAGTLVGNAQDMMIGEVAGLDFGRYALWCFTPVLFALLAACAIIWKLSCHHLALAEPAPPVVEATVYPFNLAHTIKGLVILGLVIAFFFSSIPKEVIALTAAAVHLASPKFRTEDILALVDWSVLILFMGLFVVTGAFQATGAGEQAVRWLGSIGVDLHSPSILAVMTAALSNLINNSAAVLLLVKVVDVTHVPTGYVLALANSFAGSLLLIGSVVNLIVVQQARDLGINISFRDFARLGVPVTLVALGGLLMWVALMG